MPHATKNSIRSQSKLIPHNNRYCCGERTCFQDLCHAAGITFWGSQPRRSDGRWAWPQMPYPPCRAVRCRIPARWLRCARCPNTRQTNSFIWFQQTFLDNDPLKIKTDLPGHCRKVSVKWYDIRINASICIKKAQTVTDLCELVSWAWYSAKTGDRCAFGAIARLSHNCEDIIHQNAPFVNYQLWRILRLFFVQIIQ